MLHQKLPIKRGGDCRKDAAPVHAVPPQDKSYRISYISFMAATTLSVIDSHTEGEPTRVIIDGWPELQSSTMAARRDEIAQKWDHLRAAAVLEPRGHAAIVAAILTPPVTAGAV